MVFSRRAIPLVGWPFHTAAAEKIPLQMLCLPGCHAKEGADWIWEEWVGWSRNNPVGEANGSSSAGNASLGKPCSRRGLLISARHLWPCCTVSKPSIFPWGTNSIIKFLNYGVPYVSWALQSGFGLALAFFSPQHICEENQRSFFPLVKE